MGNNLFLKNSQWIIFGRIFQMLLLLVTTMLTARYLGPGYYGVITYTAAFVSFFTSLSTLGLNNTIVNELVSNPDKQGEILGTSLVMRIVSGSVSIFCVPIIVYAINGNDKVMLAVSVLQALGLLFQSFDVFTYLYQAKLNSKVPILLGSIAYILVAFYKITILWMGKSVLWFAFASALEAMLIAAFLLVAYQKAFSQKLKFTLHLVPQLLEKSCPFILSGLMVAIYGHMDKIMLGTMLNSTAVGCYSAAVSICGMWTFILVAIIDSARPIIIEHSTTNVAMFNLRLTQLYSAIIWISIVVSCVICVFSKWIVLILYGKSYLEATIPLRIITWYTAFSYLGVAKNIWLVCSNKQKYINLMCLSGVVVNLVLNYLMIPAFGISGAAVATLVTQCVTNFIVPLCFKEIRPIGVHIIQALNLKAMYTSLAKRNSTKG